MKKQFVVILTALFALGTSTVSAVDGKKLTAYVNPMIGTSGMGHTFPGACAPFGIVQLSPETDTIPQNVIKERYMNIVRAINILIPLS